MAQDLAEQTSDDEFQSFEEDSEENTKMQGRPEEEEDDEAPEEYSNTKFAVQVPADEDGVSEEEFHTDDASDHAELAGHAEDVVNEEEEAEHAGPAETADLEQQQQEEDAQDEREIETVSAPLLPPELLNSIPSTTFRTNHTKFDFSDDDDISAAEQIPRQRDSTKALGSVGKKRMLNRLRRDSDGTGVLEAGYAAQAKRGITDRVQGGRIQKAERKRPKVSWRQQMVNERQKEIQDLREFRRPAKGRRRR